MLSNEEMTYKQGEKGSEHNDIINIAEGQNTVLLERSFNLRRIRASCCIIVTFVAFYMSVMQFHFQSTCLYYDLWE